MMYFGIDPGLTGAIAAIDESSRLIGVIDLPVMRLGKLAWIDSIELCTEIRKLRNDRSFAEQSLVMIERSQAMPGQGVSSTFSIGCTLGSILACIQMACIPLHVVSAATWKGKMLLGKDKDASISAARALFPTAELERKKDHNRAEAILIAEYARRTFALGAAA